MPNLRDVWKLNTAELEALLAGDTVQGLKLHTDHRAAVRQEVSRRRAKEAAGQ